MKMARVVLLGAAALAAAPAAAQGPGGVLTCGGTQCPAYEAPLVWGYGPTTAPTDSARTNYATLQLGWFQAGTSVRVGTCGMAGAGHTGNTFLRLFVSGTATEVAANNDSCATAGSQINYVVPHDMALELHAGCSGSTIGCAGWIAFTARLDAAPRPASVKAAFSRIHTDGVLLKSPDTATLMRGMNYQNAGWGEKYHHQGIARTYTRAHYDLAWTASVRSDAFPEYRTVFFSRLGTKTGTPRAERFAGNLGPDQQCGPYPWMTCPGEAGPADAIVYGSNAGVYDAFDPGFADDWDGIPAGRRFDHAGGLQAIGGYVATAAEFVDLPCIPNYDGCPQHGNRNIPASGQASQVVLYNVKQAAPQPSLLISRREEGAGWVAIAKLRETQAPPLLRNGYLVMVPAVDRLSLYAVQADPCTGYASLDQVRPYAATTYGTPLRLDPLAAPACPGPRTPAEQSQADVRPVAYVGCVKRVEQGDAPPDDPACPNLVSMYEDGQRHDFPPQDDVQSAHLVTQANGRVFLLAFEGQRIEWGPNSEVQLWRVVFGAASGAGQGLQELPDGTRCQAFLCLVRAGTEAARDSYKNMNVEWINGSMFRYGGGGYVVSSADPAAETLFIYGTEHYLQKTPRAALLNEF
jgi:hypothetical protein